MLTFFLSESLDKLKKKKRKRNFIVHTSKKKEENSFLDLKKNI